ncbi:hypothetical protein TR75_04715 [Hydrogenibacillus schlegelii]|uniref:Uncharacterized protein n=1 Tax=Hydrogenibacillus schlegelii TaxID=1484 RepID=A0A132N9K2_HYDSH|nr:hypothetical protein TR75_04715 [Hydrogenibacillus schlegelii]OAR04307.1 hypothetical protein SA87_01165 [Hydrogenibacillus schlegelii]PTQ50776.1 MAG: hypothetical protein HSCHL_2657 [Hydrogenibacillus schlegelii]
MADGCAFIADPPFLPLASNRRRRSAPVERFLHPPPLFINPLRNDPLGGKRPFRAKRTDLVAAFPAA